MDRTELKKRVAECKAALANAENDLISSYGAILEEIALLLRILFSSGELRRWARYVWMINEDNLSGEQSSLGELSISVARELIDSGISVEELRDHLTDERPRRKADIELALKNWPHR